MSGDFSRIGFDPQLDDFGVLWQQGRPVTDRDCNDQVLQVVRRTHAGMLDTVGPEAVPDQTADAFKITPSGTSLTIERGRMYVDGLLAENHGKAPPNGTLSWDPHLAELFGSAPLDYAKQPYDPNPPALPTAAGSHLVYLDVWQREVSHHMRDGLVDSAIGVDTTARLQTVWQVKVHDQPGAADCITPLGQLFPASAGRLTSDTANVPGQPEPCDIPPASGYKGQENQLYRVEIHKPGGLGTATFKWSRDNASVETRVTAITGLTQLIVESVKKDEVLRFSDGDWIEITDDWLELHNEPGILRRIKIGGGVDDVSRTITLDNALPSGTFPVNAQDLTEPTRHTRIRRWDQRKTIFDAAGTQIQDLDAGTPPSGEDGILVPATAGTQVLLEAGVVVDFTLQPTNGEFKSGDWWVFAARAGDTSIEVLHEAPPRGIHHHYAHLALWDPSTSDVTDCRVHWPPKAGGCCTVIVDPGESIQAAIDSLPPEGGCVCLKTGVHQIGNPILILGSSIILHGESPGTIVRSSGPELLIIGDKQKAVFDVSVMDIRFEAGVAAPPSLAPIVQASICRGLRIEGCQLACIAAIPALQAGAILWDIESLAFRGNRVEKLACGLVLDDYAETIEICGNHFQGAISEALGNNNAGGFFGVMLSNAQAGSCRVAENLFVDFMTAVMAGPEADGCVIESNTVMRAPLEFPEKAPVGIDAIRAYFDKRVYALDVLSSRCEVRGNRIELPGPAWGGVRAGASLVKVVGNLLEAPPGVAALLPASIYCAQSKPGSADRADIVGNRLVGAQTGIFISRIDATTVTANRCDEGWYGVAVDDCTGTIVGDNRIAGTIFGVLLSQGLGNRVLDNDIRESLIGIVGDQDADLEIAGNRIFGCPTAGAWLGVAGACAFIKNRVERCAYIRGDSVGVVILGNNLIVSGAMLRVEDCEVVDSGISPDGSQVSAGDVWGLAAWVNSCELVGNHVGYSGFEPALSPNGEHRALRLAGPISLRVGAGVLGFLSSALVTGNQLRGPGATSLVEFLSISVPQTPFIFQYERVTFSNNACEHWNAKPSHSATVQLRGGSPIAMGNQVKAPIHVNSIAMGGPLQGTLVGNIGTGPYVQPGGTVPTPMLNFNVVLP